MESAAQLGLLDGEVNTRSAGSTHLYLAPAGGGVTTGARLRMLGILYNEKRLIPEQAGVLGFASELQIHPRCWNSDFLVGASKKGKHTHSVE